MRAVAMPPAVSGRAACAGVLLALLGGCAMIAENNPSAVVAPGKFEYYNCEQLAGQSRTLHAREQELTELIARASDGPVGEFMGSLAYRTELSQTRGQLKQISDVSAQKQCVVQSRWQSDRALW